MCLQQYSHLFSKGVSSAAAVAAASSGRDMQRCMPYGLPGLPPGHPGMDPFLRMPGVYPPGSREALVEVILLLQYCSIIL